MSASWGREARRRYDVEAAKVEQALAYWLDEVAGLETYPDETPFFPDGLEVQTKVLFDRIPAGLLVFVLNRREKEKA